MAFHPLKRVVDPRLRLRVVGVNNEEIRIKAEQFGKVHFFSLKQSDATYKQLLVNIGDWKNGAMIQDAMPYLDADTREFFMTGLTPAEWDEMCRGL